MRLVIILLAWVLALTQAVVAQQQDEVNCSAMQSEIVVRQQSLPGLSAFLANTDGYGLLVCRSGVSLDECLTEPEAVAGWTNPETAENFLLFTRDFIIGYSQENDIPPEHTQMIFDRNDGISLTIRSSGGVEGLQAEIGVLQAEYAQLCGGG